MVALLRRPSRRALLLAGLVVALTVLLLVGGFVTMAWGDGLRRGERLLPGTSIAGVDVGGRTVEDARAAALDRVAADLDRQVVITHGERRWTTTPRDLGATSNLEQVVADAFQRTMRADLVDLARLRMGAGGVATHDVLLDTPDARVAAFVATIADAVDTPPQDATLAWVDGGVRLEDAVTGVRVEQDDAASALEAALAGSASTVPLPVAERAPAFPTEEARRVADEVTSVVDAGLDRAVTVSLEGTTRTVTPRELGARHNARALLDAGGATPADVALEIPSDAVDQVVADVASPHERASRNASLTWSQASGFAPTPGATGLAVDRAAAREALQSALLGGTDRVELELHTTTPRITMDSFGEVLLVRQGERRVELYRGGAVVRSWSVAVGTGNHPTPTGMFTIGAKRHEPTWHNPSPDSWGDDMPAVIGPGPDNPLGLRALNWERDGVDTLIRFHGTANEASIGRAASHGCVRMRNADVIELYDLVNSGTVIVSVAG